MEWKSPKMAGWRRVVQRRFVLERADAAGFQGYVTRLYIDKVNEPGARQRGGRRWCIANDGYLWVQCFAPGSHHTIRTIFDAARNVEQWYIDICKPYVLDDDGVPTYLDLDLDVVVWPDGEVELWDADELEQSLREGAISQADYDLAWAEARRLVDALRTGQLVLPRREDDLPRWVEKESVNITSNNN
ncbi:MAG: DUF402 domain-containing protein, partial [Bacillota bacterium]